MYSGLKLWAAAAEEAGSVDGDAASEILLAMASRNSTTPDGFRSSCYRQARGCRPDTRATDRRSRERQLRHQRVSQLERGADPRLSAVASYGGKLEIVAVFDDERVVLWQHATRSCCQQIVRLIGCTNSVRNRQ
jgi:hypothetical protein